VTPTDALLREVLDRLDRLTEEVRALRQETGKSCNPATLALLSRVVPILRNRIGTEVAFTVSDLLDDPAIQLLHPPDPVAFGRMLKGAVGIDIDGLRLEIGGRERGKTNFYILKAVSDPTTLRRLRPA